MMMPTEKTSPKQQTKKQRKAAKAAKERVLASHAVAKSQARRAMPQRVNALIRQGEILARQMALPGDVSDILRLPTVDMPRTATIRYHTSYGVTQPVIAAVPTGFPCGLNELFFACYGQPGRLFMYGPVSYTAAVDSNITIFGYASVDPLGTQVTTNYQYICSGTDTIQPGSSRSVPWTPVTASDTLTGTSRPIGLAKGRSYVWLDSSEKIVWTFYSNSTKTVVPGPFAVQIWRWEGPADLPTNIKTISWAKGATGSDTFSFSIPYSGYYGMDFTLGALDTDSFTGSYSVYIAIQAAVANPVRFVTEFCKTVQAAETGEYCRRTAFSLLLSNTTAEINKQGNVTAARLVAERVGAQISSGSGGYTPMINSTAVAMAAGKYTGRAANGVYTYMDFEPSVEKFQESCNNFNGVVFDLDYNGYVNTIVITNPNTSTQANTFMLTAVAHLEFQGDTQLFNYTVPYYNHDALVDARRINNTTPYFFENPLHLSDLWGFIKRSFNRLRTAAVPLGIAASTLYPEAAGVIMPAAHLLQKE